MMREECGIIMGQIARTTHEKHGASLDRTTR